MIKKYPHHSDLIFCRVPLLHTFPDNILTKYSREKLSYTEVHVFIKHNTFLGHFQFLICHALARAPGTEKGKKILNYRLCLHQFVKMWILRIWSPQIPFGSNLLAQIWVIISKRKNYSWKLQLENESQPISAIYTKLLLVCSNWMHTSNYF